MRTLIAIAAFTYVMVTNDGWPEDPLFLFIIVVLGLFMAMALIEDVRAAFGKCKK